jgi:hypothetical protein
LKKEVDDGRNYYFIFLWFSARGSGSSHQAATTQIFAATLIIKDNIELLDDIFVPINFKMLWWLSIFAIGLLCAAAAAADAIMPPANDSALPEEEFWDVAMGTITHDVAPHPHLCSESVQSGGCMPLLYCSEDGHSHHDEHSHHGHAHVYSDHDHVHDHSHQEDGIVAAVEVGSDGRTTWDDVEKVLTVFGSVGVTIRNTLPGSIVISDLTEKTNKALFGRGFTPTNTLFSSSVCPDEINHAYHDLSMIQMFTRTWGESFQMGGLAGVPFSGKTGFGAFSSHVPDDGNLFILFAPHIGITPAGEFGMYARNGQSSEAGHTCGAAVGAHQHIANGGEIPSLFHLGKYPFDYQQQWIISKIATKMDIINSADNKMVELSKQMYYIIEDFIQHIVSTEDVPGAVVLLGGVHINTPTYMEDFFWPMKFEIHRRDTPVVEDLMPELRSDFDAPIFNDI